MRITIEGITDPKQYQDLIASCDFILAGGGDNGMRCCIPGGVVLLYVGPETLLVLAKRLKELGVGSPYVPTDDQL